MKKNDSGIVSPDKRGKGTCSRKIPDFIEKHARDHILSMPKVGSHYCRKSSNKLYLSSQLNLEKLYRLYLEKCNEDNKKITENNTKLLLQDRKLPVSKSAYKVFFYLYGNLSFHKPKKDQCVTCNRYKTSSEVEKTEEKEKQDLHVFNKNRAREIKQEEVKKCTDNVQNERTVLNMDLQAVLECPNGEVPPIFYKRKLAVYNFTIFDLISKEGTCCMWDETEGNRGSTEIATCIFNYINCRKDVLEFFLMSDSCGGQNLNQFISTAFLYAVKMTHAKKIEHVYYETGHSQMEGDSLHSVIEITAKNIQVNTPSEWQLICQLARKTHKPYNVVPMTHNSFINWTSVAEENKKKARYETVDGEVVEWRKIKWFLYQKDHPESIFF
ncbi:uncharacterized protein LOC120350546 [Nilaparvata lugens]|uniref:uncharacterized protein LOC120350546 n=1 Tax=Nilaparvata lugens TaxID=108931 RepID=UPI00193E5706|nr:uncharacterized protein LOC120350546 [Nilaparvata lugens]